MFSTLASMLHVSVVNPHSPRSDGTQCIPSPMHTTGQLRRSSFNCHGSIGSHVEVRLAGIHGSRVVLDRIFVGSYRHLQSAVDSPMSMRQPIATSGSTRTVEYSTMARDNLLGDYVQACLRVGGRLVEYDPRPRSTLSSAFVGLRREDGREVISSEGRYIPRWMLSMGTQVDFPVSEFTQNGGQRGELPAGWARKRDALCAVPATNRLYSSISAGEIPVRPSQRTDSLSASASTQCTAPWVYIGGSCMALGSTMANGRI